MDTKATTSSTPRTTKPSATRDEFHAIFLHASPLRQRSRCRYGSTRMLPERRGGIG
jgi:hypothetical protein